MLLAKCTLFCVKVHFLFCSIFPPVGRKRAPHTIHGRTTKTQRQAVPGDLGVTVVDFGADFLTMDILPTALPN